MQVLILANDRPLLCSDWKYAEFQKTHYCWFLGLWVGGGPSCFAKVWLFALRVTCLNFALETRPWEGALASERLCSHNTLFSEQLDMNVSRKKRCKHSGRQKKHTLEDKMNPLFWCGFQWPLFLCHMEFHHNGSWLQHCQTFLLRRDHAFAWEGGEGDFQIVFVNDKGNVFLHFDKWCSSEIVQTPTPPQAMIWSGTMASPFLKAECAKRPHPLMFGESRTSNPRSNRACWRQKGLLMVVRRHLLSPVQIVAILPDDWQYFLYSEIHQTNTEKQFSTPWKVILSSS